MPLDESEKGLVLLANSSLILMFVCLFVIISNVFTSPVLFTALSWTSHSAIQNLMMELVFTLYTNCYHCNDIYEGNAISAYCMCD